METPVFEEFDPASDCDCPGCVHWRRVSPRSLPAGIGGHPAAHRALVVATAASAALGAGHVVPALAAPHTADRPGVPVGDGPQTPQGHKAPLHGPGGKPAVPADTVKVPATTRAEIIRRAQTWVAARVPYSMSAFWSDGYRQDCSGYVSMAWGLTGNEWTGSLHQFATRVTKEELQPGDMLLFHNPANPENGSHVVLFGGWTDSTHTYYVAYEQTRPTTRRLATPYGYWTNSDRYVPYRYKGVTAGTATQDLVGGKAPVANGGQFGAGGSGGGGDSGGSGAGVAGAAASAPAYPGGGYFGPGANNKFVTLLGRLLVERGADRFYAAGPGPRWSEADRRATQAFQLAQGWRGANADGLPGPGTWRLLATGTGKDIPVGAAGPPAPTTSAATPGRPAPAATRVPPYPGRAMFRPGADNAYVTQLGRQLAKKGFGRFYATGPGPRWGDADRRGVEAFQRAQGWRGGAADGYPGPETWRRLFS
ncbi:peptidoglycan-binding protein [Streptomyces sp. NPDC002328]|uniref:peptidoglycan-binding protein n=1 Tax=Streptomyces sp. NPDC002328 TaxID=3364642 RepID=UPI0036AEC5E9